MSLSYFYRVADLKDYLGKKEIKQRKECLGFGFSKVQVGLCAVYSWNSIPLFVFQDTPNFKTKLFVAGFPIFYKTRASSRDSLEDLYDKNLERSGRVYLNIGSLPYHDNRSGIPRVAKELSLNGLKDIDGALFPVYADPVSCQYRFASNWAKEQGFDLSKLKVAHGFDGEEDAVIDLKEGDWIVHAMINPNEIEFFSLQYQKMRNMGVKVGFILHDLIAGRHPEFYKKRTSKVFSRWLRLILQYDGVFAVSNSTLQDFKGWLCEENPRVFPKLVKAFHLGADFKAKDFLLSDSEAKQLDYLSEKKYFLHVSTIEPRKGVSQLLEAFETLWVQGKDASLVLVGRQGWKMKELCKKIRRHPKLGTQLFWFAGISDNMLQWLYKNAHCVVVPSEAEGYGLSVVEGAYWKRPLLIRDIPPFREVAPKDAVFFSGKDPKSLIDAIERIDLNITSGVWEPSVSPIKTWSDSYDAFMRCFEDKENEITR